MQAEWDLGHSSGPSAVGLPALCSTEHNLRQHLDYFHQPNTHLQVSHHYKHYKNNQEAQKNRKYESAVVMLSKKWIYQG